MCRKIMAHLTSPYGFTLVEVLAVVTLLSMLSGLIIPKVIGNLDKSKEKACQINIKALESAVDRFYLDTGQYPDTNLNNLISNAALDENIRKDWSGPYVTEIPICPVNQAENAYSVDANGKVTCSHSSSSGGSL